MKTCPEAQRLFETGEIDPNHCDVCRELSQALETRETDLERGIEAFARGGDLEAALGRALKDAPQGAQRPAGFDRTFHYTLIAAVAAAVLFFFGLSQLAPAPPPPPSDVAAATTTREASAIEALVDEAESTEWHALSAEEWAEIAQELWDGALALDKANDPSLRRLLFRTWAQAGNAAENANSPTPPFYAKRGGKVVNDAWFRAGTMLVADDSLRALITSDSTVASVDYLARQIRAGELPRTYGPELDRDDIEALLEETADRSWDALPEDEWARRALVLHDAASAMERVSNPQDPKVRKLLFSLWSESARAAQASNRAVEPHFSDVSGKPVLVGWYRAGGLALQDPGLLSGLDEGLAASIEYYVDLIGSGELPDPYGKEVEGARSSKEWTDHAYSLREQIIALEKANTQRTSDGPALFAMLIECGNAAARSGNPSPPFYDQILDDKPAINVCWYRAASMMEEDPSLTIADAPIAQRVEVYRDFIREGARPIAGLSKW